MFKSYEVEQPIESKSLWKVAARVPWPALLACCLYLPGIVLWAVYSLRCKANTFEFLTTVAPVAKETVDGVNNTVYTTLFTLAAGGTFIFALLLVLAIARSIQRAGVSPNSCCPCARPTASSFYLYRVFNMGFNIIVFFVNLAIVFLMMGAFLWLVVAYAANLSIKGGVRAAADAGIDPVEQVLQANRAFNTVVSDYEKQLQQTPPLVANSTWFKELNSTVSKILEPIPFITNGTLNATNGTASVNTLLCPQTCLNLGSFATLFKLQQNCICSSDQLAALQEYSATVSADAGVCLAGVMLIYLACSTLHAYLIGQYVHAGYDYRAAKQRYAELIKQRRRQHALSNGSLSSNSRRHHKGGGTTAAVVPAGPLNGGPGYVNGVVGDGGFASGEDEEMGLGGQQLQQHYSGSNQQQLRGRSYGELQRNSSSRAIKAAGGNEIQLSAAAAGGVSSGLARHSSQSSPTHGTGHGSAARGWPQGDQGSAVAPVLNRSSSGAMSGGMTRDPALLSAESGSLAAVASIRAWERSQQQQQQSSGAAGYAAAAGKDDRQQQQQQSGGDAASHVPHVSHARTGSKSSAGSIREILLGAVPLDHTSSYQHSQQQQQQQLAPAGSGGSTAAASAANTEANNLARSSSSNTAHSAAPATRDGVSHKPSSSGGSYESMIYHSPRNSECGGSSASSPAVAMAGAAAAAGHLLDLTPQGLSRLQQRRQQQQQHSVQQASLGHWARRGASASLEDGSSELPTVAEAPVSSPTGTEQPAAAPAAGPGAAGSTQASPSSGTDTNPYDTYGSKASSTGDTIGSLTGSGRKGGHSHRRLPAFDFTSTAHQFMTVEGLEQQQMLQKELGSRPNSPPAVVEEVQQAADTQQDSQAEDVDDIPAAAAGGDADVGAQRQPSGAGSDRPSTTGPPATAAASSATIANSAAAAAPAAAVPAESAVQSRQVPLPVRRRIAMPAHLQLPTQNEDLGATQQSQPQQQHQQRMPFASPLLPPPEQQQLLLQRQQQQLALLLQQEEQQWQPSGPGHQRHWSTPTAAAVAGRSGSSSPAAGVYGFHHHSTSAVEPPGGFSGYGVGFTTTVPSQLNAGSGFVQPGLGGSVPMWPGSNGLYPNSRGLKLSNGSPVDSSSAYNTPEPSPLPGATPVSTPLLSSGLGNLLIQHAASSSNSSAAVAPLLVGSSLSAQSSFTASQTGLPGSSMMSSFNGGMTPIGASTPRSIPGTAGSSSSTGSPAAAAAGLQLSNSMGSNVGMPGSSLGGMAGLPPTIPEAPISSGLGAEDGIGLQQQLQGVGCADVATAGSPLERRRSGYRSSMRKGLMAYDQYKHRQRYQQEVSSPLDPRTELNRRYRNRVPAV